MPDRFLCFDCETTGLALPSAAALDSQPRIIEFAVVEISAGAIVGEHAWLINPEKPLSPEITKITKLTDSDLRDAPVFAEVLPKIVEIFLGARGLIAHNLPFDRALLLGELQRLGKEFAFPWPPEQICTVAAFEHLKGHRLKLIELYERVMGRELHQTHRALDDARALAEIVLKEGVI